jgi:uncharacterized protein (DUF3820 family)
MKPEHLQLLLVREMPFGKYQGKKIAELPGHYLAWLARERRNSPGGYFAKGELGELLELMYEIDHNDLRALLNPLKR